jgi:hypothetical protein
MMLEEKFQSKFKGERKFLAASKAAPRTSYRSSRLSVAFSGVRVMRCSRGANSRSHTKPAMHFHKYNRRMNSTAPAACCAIAEGMPDDSHAAAMKSYTSNVSMHRMRERALTASASSQSNTSIQ